jgi:hypothetical protein
MRETIQLVRAWRSLKAGPDGTRDYDRLYGLGVPGRMILHNILSRIEDNAEYNNHDLVASRNGNPDRVSLGVNRLTAYSFRTGILVAEALNLGVVLDMKSDEATPAASLAVNYKLANEKSETWDLANGVAKYKAPSVHGVVKGPFDHLKSRVSSDFEAALIDPRLFVLQTAQRVLDASDVAVIETPVLQLPN